MLTNFDFMYNMFYEIGVEILLNQQKYIIVQYTDYYYYEIPFEAFYE